MTNPFDQFDTVQKNPFDQFDKQPNPQPASANPFDQFDAPPGDFMRGIENMLPQAKQNLGYMAGFVGEGIRRGGASLEGHFADEAKFSDGSTRAAWNNGEYPLAAASTVKGVGDALGVLVGAGIGGAGEWARDASLSVAAENAQKAQQLSRPSDNWSGVHSVGDAADWLQYNAGQGVGNFGQAAVTSGLGAVAGSFIPGVGTAAGAASGMASGALNDGLGSTVGNIIQEGSTDLGTGQRLPDGKVLEGLSNKQMGYALEGGAGAAALEFAGDKVGLGAALHGTGATGGIAKRAAQGFVSTGAKEAATEVGQTAAQLAGAEQPLTDANARQQYLDSGMAGFVQGGMTGGVSDGVRAARDAGAQRLASMPADQARKLRYDAPELDAYAAAVEQKYGLPDGILTAIKNAGEKSNSDQVSPAGARGVMQFMPENLAKFGVTDPTNPMQMIDAAGRYFQQTSKQYGGNVAAMIADYNGGPRQAKHVLDGEAPSAPETAAYLDRVQGYMASRPSGAQASNPAADAVNVTQNVTPALAESVKLDPALSAALADAQPAPMAAFDNPDDHGAQAEADLQAELEALGHGDGASAGLPVPENDPYAAVKRMANQQLEGGSKIDVGGVGPVDVPFKESVPRGLEYDQKIAWNAEHGNYPAYSTPDFKNGSPPKVADLPSVPPEIMNIADDGQRNEAISTWQKENLSGVNISPAYFNDAKRWREQQDYSKPVANYPDSVPFSRDLNGGTAVEGRRTPSNWSPVADQMDAQVLSEAVGMRLPSGDFPRFTAMAAPQEIAPAVDALQRVFGKKVVFVQGEGEARHLFQGAIVPSRAQNRIFVNVDSPTGYLNVIGHELYEHLKHDRPDLHQWFAGIAEKQMRNLPEYQRRLAAVDARHDGKPLDQQAAFKELLADFTGDALASPEFLMQLAADHPGKFRQFVGKVLGWLDSLVAKLQGRRDAGSVAFFRDVEGLRQHLRAALAEYANPDAPYRGFENSNTNQTTAFSHDASDGARYRAELGRAMDNRRSADVPVTMGRTPEVLRAVGMPDLPTIISRDTVRKATNGVKHSVPMDTVRALPELLANPIMVFDSDTQAGAKVALVEAVDANGHPVVVAVQAEVRSGFLAVNRIASMYGKDNAGVFPGWISKGLLRYWDKDRSLQWLRSRGLQLPKENTIAGYGDRLLTAKGAVKPEVEFMRFPATQEEATALYGKVAGAVMDGLRTAWMKNSEYPLKAMSFNGLVDRYGKLFDGFKHNPMRQLEEGKRMMRAVVQHWAERFQKSHDLFMQLPTVQRKQVTGVMFDATMLNMHPDRAYEKSIDIPWAVKRIGVLVKRDKKDGGDYWTGFKGDLEAIAADERRQPRNQALTPEQRRQGTAKANAGIRALEAKIRHERKRSAEYPNLKAKWAALNPKQQQVYTDWRDNLTKLWEKQTQALEDRIMDIASANGLDPAVALEARNTVQGLRTQFRKQLRIGPYFPLKRYGNNVVGVRDGADYSRWHFDTVLKAQKFADEVRRDKPGAEVLVTAKTNATTVSPSDAAGQAGKLLKILKDSGGLSSAQLDEINKFVIDALPDISARKTELHRFFVEGADKDMERAFANSMLHGGHDLSRILFGHKVQAALAAMDEQVQLPLQLLAGKFDQEPIKKEAVKNSLLIAEKDLPKAAQVVKVMKQQVDAMMNPNTSPLAAFMGNLAFTWYLGFSPMAGIINLTQTQQVTFPVLAARFGTVKAQVALLKAAADVMRASRIPRDTQGNVDIRQSIFGTSDAGYLPAHEQAILKALEMDGTTETTQQNSLAATANGDGKADMGPLALNLSRAMAISGFFFHNAEILNRQVAQLAAVRLVRDADAATKGKIARDFGSDLDYARWVTERTHFDYAHANRSLLIKGNTAKILLPMKNYSFLMAEFMLTRVRDVLSAEKNPEVRALAAKEMLHVMGMTALMAGVSGLPMVWLVKLALGMLMGDKDKPWDADAAWSKFLQDNLGDTGERLVNKGAVNALTGLDLSSRIGLDSLFFKEAGERDQGGDWVRNYIEQLAGANASLAIGVADGVDLLEQGQYRKGLEKMVPKSLRDISKAQRYFTDGMTNPKNDELVAADQFNPLEIASQALGMSPDRVTAAYDHRKATDAVLAQMQARKTEIMNQARRFRMDGVGDWPSIRQAILRFNGLNPDIAIEPKDIERSVKSAEKARTGRESNYGLNIPKGYGQQLRADGWVR